MSHRATCPGQSSWRPERIRNSATAASSKVAFDKDESLDVLKEDAVHVSLPWKPWRIPR